MFEPLSEPVVRYVHLHPLGQRPGAPRRLGRWLALVALGICAASLLTGCGSEAASGAAGAIGLLIGVGMVAGGALDGVAS